MCVCVWVCVWVCRPCPLAFSVPESVSTHGELALARVDADHVQLVETRHRSQLPLQAALETRVKHAFKKRFAQGGGGTEVFQIAQAEHARAIGMIGRRVKQHADA